VDNIIAIEVALDSGDLRYFLTWGRVQDAVDTIPVQELVLRASSRFELGGKAVAARVCDSLQEAMKQIYFFESFFAMCQRPITFGEHHDSWRSEMDEKMRLGQEIYFLGALSE
jgi:hypothetical protein